MYLYIPLFQRKKKKRNEWILGSRRCDESSVIGYNRKTEIKFGRMGNINYLNLIKEQIQNLFYETIVEENFIFQHDNSSRSCN